MDVVTQMGAGTGWAAVGRPASGRWRRPAAPRWQHGIVRPAL